MGEEQILNLIMQVGIIPALLVYTMVSIKKALDNNTIILTKLYERMGGKNE